MHSHQEPGDPRAGARLSVAIEELRTALRPERDERELQTAAHSARLLAQALLPDANPRTRSQARGLAMVASLIDDDRREDARQLLEQELWRSFPGRGDETAQPGADRPN
jgi:hypothetical protein